MSMSPWELKGAFARRTKRAVTRGNFSCDLQCNRWRQNGEARCRIRVTRCNLSRNVANSRILVYFSFNSQRIFSLRDVLRRGGVTHAIWSTTCLATPLRCKLQKNCLLKACTCVCERRNKMLAYYFCDINPLSPNSNKYVISPYSITSQSNTQVMRIKEKITKSRISWCLSKFSQLVP